MDWIKNIGKELEIYKRNKAIGMNKTRSAEIFLSKQNIPFEGIVYSVQGKAYDWNAIGIDKKSGGLLKEHRYSYKSYKTYKAAKRHVAKLKKEYDMRLF